MDILDNGKAYINNKTRLSYAQLLDFLPKVYRATHERLGIFFYHKTNMREAFYGDLMLFTVLSGA